MHIAKNIISCFVKTRNNFFSLEMEAIHNYFYAHTGTLGTSDSPAFMENMHSAWINSPVNNVPRLQGRVLRSAECKRLITETGVDILF
jgi:hypothetical protein